MQKTPCMTNLDGHVYYLLDVQEISPKNTSDKEFFVTYIILFVVFLNVSSDRRFHPLRQSATCDVDTDCINPKNTCL